jgi:hypothetical protein
MEKPKDRAGPPMGQPSDLDAPLPHDRDERSVPADENAQHRQNRETIEQAHDDVESGVQDTERIGTPNDVPSSRRNG